MIGHHNNNMIMMQGSFVAVPWQGEDPPLFAGAPAMSDLILWGAVAGGVLLACIISMCCFAVLQSAHERSRAEKLLAEDRRALLDRSKP